MNITVEDIKRLSAAVNEVHVRVMSRQANLDAETAEFYLFYLDQYSHEEAVKTILNKRTKLSYFPILNSLLTITELYTHPEVVRAGQEKDKKLGDRLARLHKVIVEIARRLGDDVLITDFKR